MKNLQRAVGIRTRQCRYGAFNEKPTAEAQNVSDAHIKYLKGEKAKLSKILTDEWIPMEDLKKHGFTSTMYIKSVEWVLAGFCETTIRECESRKNGYRLKTFIRRRQNDKDSKGHVETELDSKESSGYS